MDEMFFPCKLGLDIDKITFFSGPINCVTDSDCPDHLACGDDEECVDPPCPDCAANAHCEVKNHTITGICICNSDYPLGDPYLEGCKRKQS